MTEKELVLDGLELNYSGIFNLQTLLRTIDELLADKGYKKNEKIREELVRPSGKFYSIELRPSKTMTEFEALMIKMRITITDLKKADVIVDNVKRKIDQGNINIIFDAWTSTDYEFRWEQKAWFWLLRGFFERIFFRVHTNKHHSVLIDDTHYVFNNIKSHLNLHRFVLGNNKKE